jgi:hypothetical protein
MSLGDSSLRLLEMSVFHKSVPLVIWRTHVRVREQRQPCIASPSLLSHYCKMTKKKRETEFFGSPKGGQRLMLSSVQTCLKWRNDFFV